jgi:hypothetical protein
MMEQIELRGRAEHMTKLITFQVLYTREAIARRRRKKKVTLF